VIKPSAKKLWDESYELLGEGRFNYKHDLWLFKSRKDVPYYLEDEVKKGRVKWIRN